MIPPTQTYAAFALSRWTSPVFARWSLFAFHDVSKVLDSVEIQCLADVQLEGVRKGFGATEVELLSHGELGSRLRETS